MNFADIDARWAKNEFPILNGIAFESGLFLTLSDLKNGEISRVVRVESLIDIETNLALVSAQLTWSFVMAAAKLELSDRTYYGGEGSWGGDGFVACFDRARDELLWMMSSERLNPILSIRHECGRIIAENNLQQEFSFPAEVSASSLSKVAW